jgi:molybdopterin converting factor small subunit
MIEVCVEYLLEKEKQDQRVVLNNGDDIATLLIKLGISADREYLAIVNGTSRLPDYVLADGDNVKLFPMMSGG